MQSPIERIINNDRKARETVEAAQRRRKESVDALALKKAELEAEVRAEVAEAAKSAKEYSEKESDRLTEEYRRNAEEISRRMDALYAEKKDEWVEIYTRRVIEGR